jgi:VTC domain
MSTSNLPLPESAAPLQRERKFVLESSTAEQFWSIASAHLRPADVGRFKQYVRTTYFDTEDLSYLRSNRGSVSRSLRVREYGVANGAGIPVMMGACFVELKQSAGGLRLKSRTPVLPHDVPRYLARQSGSQLRPCMTTWYHRAALQDPGDTIRLTLDEGLAFCKPIALGSPCDGPVPPNVVARGPERVLEVKLRGQMPSWLAQSLRGLSETVGFSKFRVGMAAMERAQH